MTNWTGDPNELLSLDEAAKLIPGADADTLKRLIRAGKLTAYRPGKKFLTTRADVRAAVEATRVGGPASKRSVPPNSLGFTEMELSRLRLDQVLSPLEQRKATHQSPIRPKRGQRADVWEKYRAEKARMATAHQLEIQERRRARARARYRELKAERQT